MTAAANQNLSRTAFFGNFNQCLCRVTVAHDTITRQILPFEPLQRRRDNFAVGLLNFGFPTFVTRGIFFWCVKGIRRPLDYIGNNDFGPTLFRSGNGVVERTVRTVTPIHR